MILVTGGTGFIGSHLVEALLQYGKKVRVLALKEPIDEIEKENEKIIQNKGAEIVYGDLYDINSVNSAMKGINTVFHLGAISRPMKILSSKYYETNVQGTRNLLKVASKSKLKKFIHVSTVSVLGLSPDGHPLKEDEFQYDDLEYGLSKREAEHIVMQYHYRNNLPVVVIRPSLVYGPRCAVRLVMFKYVKHRIFPLINNGEARMEFAYVDNIVQALLLAESNDKVVGEIFNITDGQSYKIKDILKTIADQLNVKPPLINIPIVLGTFLGYCMEILSGLLGVYPPFSRGTAKWMSEDVNVYDCSKSKKLLGYKPKVNLKEGIKRTSEWFVKRGDL